jgi:hypothetical protein
MMQRYRIIGPGKTMTMPSVIHRVVGDDIVSLRAVAVFRTYVGDRDSDTIEIAMKILIEDFFRSESGRFVAEHSRSTPEVYFLPNMQLLGWDVVIYAQFTEADLTFWQLRWN